MKYFESIITIICVILFYGVLFYAIFDLKLDYVKECKRLILWYTIYETNGATTRKYVTLLKF